MNPIAMISNVMNIMLDWIDYAIFGVCCIFATLCIFALIVFFAAITYSAVGEDIKRRALQQRPAIITSRDDALKKDFRGSKTLRVTISRKMDMNDEYYMKPAKDLPGKIRKLKAAIAPNRFCIHFAKHARHVRGKASTNDINLWSMLDAGDEYDIICKAANWKYDVAEIIGIDPRRYQEIDAWLDEFFPRAVAEIVQEFACKFCASSRCVDD